MIPETMPKKVTAHNGEEVSFRRVGDICEVVVFKDFEGGASDYLPAFLTQEEVSSIYRVITHTYEKCFKVEFKMKNWTNKVEFHRDKQVHKLEVVFPGSLKDLMAFLKSKEIGAEFAEPGFNSEKGILIIKGS